MAAVLLTCAPDGQGRNASGLRPAMHRVLRNRTFTVWETAGSSLPGKRPGEGDVIATQADGTKVVRYEGTAPRRGLSER